MDVNPCFHLVVQVAETHCNCLFKSLTLNLKNRSYEKNNFTFLRIKSLTQHFAKLNNYSRNRSNFILLSEAELSNAGEQLNKE